MPHSLASHLKHPAKECLACFKRLEPVSSCSNIHRSDFQIAFFAFGQQWLFSGKAGETAFQRFLRSHLCCTPHSLASHLKHPAKERLACFTRLEPVDGCGCLCRSGFPLVFLSTVLQAPAFRKETGEALQRFLRSHLCCMPHSLARKPKLRSKGMSRHAHAFRSALQLAFLSAVPQAPAFRKKTNEALRRFPPRRLRRRKHYDASSSLTDTMRDTPRSSIATP